MNLLKVFMAQVRRFRAFAINLAAALNISERGEDTASEEAIFDSHIEFFYPYTQNFNSCHAGN
jgi:hypothetical protein